MSGGGFRRIVEAFFRRWPFYIALLVAALTMGFATVSRATDDYTSSGAIFVDNQSLVTVQSGVQDGGFFSYLTPAQFTSQELNGLLGTDVFMEAVIETAGIQPAPDTAGRIEQADLFRAGITSFASSESLVNVSVTTDDPELSSQLASASIDEFIRFQISVDIAESEASEQFFTELTDGYRNDLNQARQQVDAALNNVETLEQLTAEEQLELERLQEAEVQAEARFQSSVENVEASRLASLQVETDVRQSYSVVDPPQLPSGPNGGFLDDLTVLAIFGLVGMMLALMGPVISALLNRGVLFVDDIERIAGAQVVAVIPRARRRTLKLEGAAVVPVPPETVLAPLDQIATVPYPGPSVDTNGNGHGTASTWTPATVTEANGADHGVRPTTQVDPSAARPGGDVAPPETTASSRSIAQPPAAADNGNRNRAAPPPAVGSQWARPNVVSGRSTPGSAGSATPSDGAAPSGSGLPAAVTESLTDPLAHVLADIAAPPPTKARPTPSRDGGYSLDDLLDEDEQGGGDA